MMRRPPPRPGQGKKAPGTGFKVTYSLNRLLTIGKGSISDESECPPPEGWEKFGYTSIVPFTTPDESLRGSRQFNEKQQFTEKELASLVLKPGSARDLHAEELAKMTSSRPAPRGGVDPSPPLGPRGNGAGEGGARGPGGGGLAWSDRYGDRNKADRGGISSRYDQDRDRRFDMRRDRPGVLQREGPGSSGVSRPPSRWDALKPDRDRDRGYNNRNNRERADLDDDDGGNRQDARAGGRYFPLSRP